jgi:hypothetical protein
MCLIIIFVAGKRFGKIDNYFAIWRCFLFSKFKNSLHSFKWKCFFPQNGAKIGIHIGRKPTPTLMSGSEIREADPALT